jgi:CIC family chloride channel protein
MTTLPPYSRAWLLLHVRVLAVGMLAGLVAFLFRLALEATERARPWLFGHLGAGPFAVLASVAFSLVTIVPAVLLVAWLAPEASGSGIPQVKALARHPAPLRWLRVLVVKFAAGVLGIGGGLALGREGPTVQMGTALGSMLGPSRAATPGEQRQLLLVGAGAGLAGAFNAPLAGALFVFEELGEDLRPGTVLAALLATFSADAVYRWLTGQGPQLGVYAGLQPPLTLLPWFLLLGWLAGLAGVLFNQALLRSLRLAGRLRRRLGAWLLPALVALLTGVAGWLDPHWVGGGHQIIEEQLSGGEMAFKTALFLLGLRFLLTVGGYATGAAGGLFAPLLVLGALLGYGVGRWAPGTHHLGFVVVGMAALFTGIVRAPLTGVLLMIEMAGAYTLVVPLVGACLMAKLIADALGDRPVYEALLAEQQRKGTAPPAPGGGRAP